MKRLQTVVDGKWRWVFCRHQPSGRLMVCDDKGKALPSKPCYAQDDLAWAQKTWPDRQFRLAETLEEGLS